MEKQRRRDIINDYKERKAQPGVFTVRCEPSGQIWVGTSRNLDSQQNSIWFSLRVGSYRNKPLQAAWTAHGEGAFAYASVEVVDAEGLSAYLLNQRLKERLDHWRTSLGAAPIIA